MRHAALPFALFLAAAAAAQEAPDPGLTAVMAAPPEIREETQQATGFCLDAGGLPRLTGDYLRSAELNGDGVPDYVIDMVGLECPGAALPFCGSEGCLVTVWLSGADGLARAWGGYARAVAIAEGGVLVEQTGASCTPAAESCEQRVSFDGVAPETAAAPAARPAPGGEPVGAWTLRAVPDGDPVAVSDGPGRVAEAAVFCLGGAPWLALTLEPPPGTESATVGFAFSAETVETTARREEGAGGGYVVELAGSPLAGLLAGRDSRVAVTLDGAPEGVLSLSGSTRAIRGALAPCGGA